MSERLKLLFHSNSTFAPTGYGQQTALFAPRLNQHADVTISSFYGLEGSPLKLGDVELLPGNGGDYGNETIPLHAQHVFGSPRGGLIVTLMDVWVLDPAMIAAHNVASWVPVDHDPVPPAIASYFRQSGAIPVAMSKFGKRQLAEFDPLYVPHAVDTSVYTPQDKAECRRITRMPEDAYIVGMVAANKGNPSRKCFPQALRAFARFRESCPQAHLYLHTEIHGKHDGVDLAQLITALKLQDAVSFPDQYVYRYRPPTPRVMAQVYSCFDVLLNPSAGEGFGIPPLEAQACGVPAIVTDFTAMSEVCGAGWKVNHRPIWTALNSWQADPDVDDITEALLASQQMSEGKRAKMSAQAVEHAARYDVERVLHRYWLPALKQIRERLSDREPICV